MTRVWHKRELAHVPFTNPRTVDSKKIAHTCDLIRDSFPQATTMRAATQDLLTLLQSEPFRQGDPTACAAASQSWYKRHNLDSTTMSSLLVQFSAQLLHAVRSNQLAPKVASDLLARLIALSDLEMPPSLFALQEVLARLAEQASEVAATGAEQEQFVRREMGRILPTLPQRDSHESDSCRYTGRYGALRRSA